MERIVILAGPKLISKINLSAHPGWARRAKNFEILSSKVPKNASQKHYIIGGKKVCITVIVNKLLPVKTSPHFPLI